ncbi:VanZ family protein [Xanthomonas citri]|uniref:VanZ family protein n=1 Tax=Xanthomonas citri TaxID=346 RepID=UPI000528BCCB|nr:VanZ family protein [Xanthomonas citri]MBE0313739.1 VanZ family protein [Xanthomonas citri pv. punicae]MDS0762435.1 VanZ family protein [Xanthomonas citri pv. punicae]MDS0766258.1 VanZ family protein [Xanthomonas citri pv. punicae]MDS0801020.1 VanZ family protein [Xanthomonas citri pv. punicae]MDS0833651.1 VanZ family protein [Xanthomonas citri pv. punicae]
MAVVSSALRPFHRSRLWVGLWIAAIVVVIAVCLGPPPEFPELPSNSDKAEHFITFALLCWGAVQLFATRRALVFAAFGLVLLGIGIEIAQGALTTNRSADPYDALADTLGILAGLCLAWTPLRYVMLRIDQRLFGRRRR